MQSEALAYKKEWQAAQQSRLDSGVEADSFVYLHVNADDGVPHHVGIGFKKGRPWNLKRNDKHRNKVAKHGLRVEIVADNLTWEQACFWEVHWIKALRTAGYELTNLTDGGEGAKGLEAHNKKSVLCLETGELFGSVEEASKKFNLSIVTISDVCREKYRLIDGLHFVYSNEPFDEKTRKKKIREIELRLARRRKRVLFNKTHYHGVVDGKDVKGRSAAGPAKISRKVYSVTDDLYFPSASAAARHYNVAKSAVIELCLGKNNRKTVGGIVFKYVGEA